MCVCVFRGPISDLVRFFLPLSFFLGLVIVIFLCVSVWVCALEVDVRISLALCSRLDDGLES